MKKIITVIAAVLFTFSVHAKAEGVKFGVDYLMLSSEVDVLDFDTSAIQFRISNELNPYFDLEGVLALGIGDDTYTIADPTGTVSVTGQLGNMFGIFAKLHSDSSSPFQIFGRVGLAMVEYDIDTFIDVPGFITGSASESFDDTGIAFGVGASFNITDKSAIVAEYSKLPDVDADGIDIETDMISIGFQMSF